MTDVIRRWLPSAVAVLSIGFGAATSAAAAPPEYATNYFVASLPPSWHLVSKSPTRVALAAPGGRSDLTVTAEPHALLKGVQPRMRSLLASIRAAGGTRIVQTNETTGDPRWHKITYRLRDHLILVAVADDGAGDAIVVRARVSVHAKASDRVVFSNAVSYVGRADIGD